MEELEQQARLLLFLLFSGAQTQGLVDRSYLATDIPVLATT